MSAREILLVGAGGHAVSCIDVIEQEGRFVIAGLIGRADEVGRHVLGYRVVGTDADLESFARSVGRAIVTVGQIKTPEPRMRLFERLLALGYELPSIVAPRAHVSRHASLGAGTIVMHGALINAGASIGRNSIVNSQALVEHDAAVGDHCHVATGAIVNGGASVATGTFVGSHSTLRQGVRIGERCVVGMGQQVLADLPGGTVLAAPRRPS